MAKKKNFLEFLIIPLIFFLVIGGIIFFELIKNISQPKLKIVDLTNLTNEERTVIREGSEVLFQVQLMKKELKNLERKTQEKTKIQALKERINQFEKDLTSEENISEIKKICQNFWDSRLWQEIAKLRQNF